MNRIILFSWFLLIASLVFFGAVVYETGLIQADAAERASAASAADQQLDRSAYAQRVHAIVVDTKSERDQLDAFAHLDIVGSVQMFEGTGKDAGITATVTDATPESDGTDVPGGEKLQSVVFSITAAGSRSVRAT